MTVSISDLELYMLGLVNGERAASGLAPLALEMRLSAAAEGHSAWMIEADSFGHAGAGGNSFLDRVKAADYDLVGAWRASENVGIAGSASPAGWTDEVERLHVGLMQSPGHRANILDPGVHHVGIGLVDGLYTSGVTYSALAVTQNFGRTSGTVMLHDAELGFRLVGTGGADHLATGEAGGSYFGQGGDDLIEGGAGAILHGEDGDDHLIGGAALHGGAGGDRLNGGMEPSLLEGGAGADAFVFDILPQKGPDTVLDFERRQDRIEIEADLIGAAPGAVSYDFLRKGMVARDPGDRLLYDHATRTAWIDPDGAGGLEATRLVVFGEDSDIPRIADVWLV